MNAPTDPAVHLRRQLLEWIAAKPRTYAETIDAWRTSCPRLSIWEDACIDGLIDCAPDGRHIVSLTDKARAVLGARNPLDAMGLESPPEHSSGEDHERKPRASPRSQRTFEHS